MISQLLPRLRPDVENKIICPWPILEQSETESEITGIQRIQQGHRLLTVMCRGVQARTPLQLGQQLYESNPPPF